MLRYLAIRNLAVIDRVEVDLAPGLTVLTGETGAGKSMFVEAIDLLAGGRASADLVRSGEDSAIVQAIFSTDDRDVIVKREVSAQGRSRAMIDDEVVTTTALRELGRRLVDLHGQHEHQSLLDPAEHVGLLDAWAGHTNLVEESGHAFDVWQSAAKALERTQLTAREKAARIEWVTFQLHDLDRVGPKAGEDDALAAERAVLANADRLTRLTTEAFAALYEDESSVLSNLGSVWKRVGELAALDQRFTPYLEHRDEVRTRLDDLALALRDYLAHLEASPDRLQVVEDRLAALEGLKKKHGPALDDVLAKQAALHAELAALQASDAAVADLERDELAAADRFRHAAGVLSTARSKAGARLSRALESSLGDLAMPKCRVDLRVAPSPDDRARWSRMGFDEVEFYLSPNLGEELRPLARIASGGELSRIMLALKTLAVVDSTDRTLVFDEVDAGIGGAAADAVGAKLADLGRRCQVFCITHLPQIAARGQQHVRISKRVEGRRTVTVVDTLGGEDRVLEIARMIAGGQVSDSVLASARELLASRAKVESQAKGESESHRSAKAKGRRGA